MKNKIILNKKAQDLIRIVIVASIIFLMGLAMLIVFRRILGIG